MSGPAYIFTGGGSGGHLFPGMAVAGELRAIQPAAEILFVGSEREIERRILAESGYRHHPLPVAPLSMLRRHPLRFIGSNRRAFAEAGRLLRRRTPDAVIGLGGLAAVPVVRAASSLGVPVILLEQNVVLGRANRFLCKRASLVCLSFEQTRGQLPRRVPVRVTGNPVRGEIRRLFESSRAAGRPTLLVLGGSQGARAVNEAVLGTASELSARLAGWRIIHQTGSERVDHAKQRYRDLKLDVEVRPFFADMVRLYSQAALVVCRAGGTTLAELACAGVPAVLVPYPGSVGDHQRLNARAFAGAGAARLVEQQADPAGTAGKLVRALRRLLEEEPLRQGMQEKMRGLARPGAAEEVAGGILHLATGRRAA